MADGKCMHSATALSGFESSCVILDTILTSLSLNSLICEIGNSNTFCLIGLGLCMN